MSEILKRLETLQTSKSSGSRPPLRLVDDRPTPRDRLRRLAARAAQQLKKVVAPLIPQPGRVGSWVSALFFSAMFGALAFFLFAIFIAPSGIRPKDSKPTEKKAEVAPTTAGAVPVVTSGPRAPSRTEIDLMREASEQLRAGKSANAIALLERATGTNPFLIHGLFLLSAEYQKLGMPEKATASLMRILQVEPRNAQAYNNLGVIQLRLKRFERATPLLEKAVQFGASEPEAWLNLGVSYEQELRWTDSLQAYRRFLELVQAPKDKAVTSLEQKKILDAVIIKTRRLDGLSKAEERAPASTEESEEGEAP